MKVIVDRIDDNNAIVETTDKKFFKIPIDLIPNVKEGDVVVIEIDKEKTQERRQEMKNLMHSVWEDID